MTGNENMGEAAAMIGELVTPALIIDQERLVRITRRLSNRATKLGVVLRPHMKTAKSIDVAGIIVVDNTSEELEALLCHDSRLLTCGRCLTIGDAAHCHDGRVCVS